jgi:hypothetical protein
VKTHLNSEVFVRDSLGRQPEQPFDEVDVTPNITPANPRSLPFSDHVNRLVASNRSPRSAEFAEALLGVHPPFDRTVILLLVAEFVWVVARKRQSE